MDSKLQDKSGTWSTSCRVNNEVSLIVPIPAITESEPFAILTFLLPAQRLYDENNLEQPVMWLVAPESIIHEWTELGVTL